ncbi:FAD-dependent oxidoreductase [Aurantibacter sp.]|uniref:FAD-dependent oxidoreductase n=1 Tax=Aurantibacter sp. TaxID=2807103 RepID=UPI0032665BE9
MKKREFIKTIGIGTGAMITNITTLYGNDNKSGTSNLDANISDHSKGDFKLDNSPYKKKQYKCDVMIAGGGMAGLCAALAAARNGSKVVLVQDRSRLGGNASSEIRMHISGASQLNQVWRETGILEELVLTEANDNPQRCYEMWDFVLYDKVISEKNITLLLDTVLYNSEVENGQIKKVQAICSATEEISEITADFFADCTGDGTLAVESGAEYMRGRESKTEWGESLAVDVADQKTMGNSLLFTATKWDKKMPYTPPVWARKYTTKDFIHRNIGSYEYGYWWLELGGEIDIVRDGQQNRHDLLAVLFGVWDYIKNSENHPESANWALSWVGMIPGKRESRRIVGDYIMKQEDIQSAKSFYDRVAYGGWPLDDHPPGGMDTTGEVPYVSIPLKGPYSIPFRSLYSKNVSNLLMAGRNISVSHVALSSTRVMATCAGLGQAIGTAMAYCKTNAILPTILGNDKKRMAKLQQILLLQDQPILEVRNEDENDLAKKATLKASSEVENSLAANVTDGINRDINDGNLHEWKGKMDSNGAWIELRWKKPINLKMIQITFDTGLNRFLRLSPQDWVYKDQVRGPQPETIADYTISTVINNKNISIAKIENNYLRRQVHNFEPIKTDKVRIDIHRTNGDAMAKIFEIRCY